MTLLPEDPRTNRVKFKMFNVDVALSGFWQFARCWKKCESAKLELSCDKGYLKMHMSANLCHPDQLHFPPPLPLTVLTPDISITAEVPGAPTAGKS